MFLFRSLLLSYYLIYQVDSFHSHITRITRPFQSNKQNANAMTTYKSSKLNLLMNNNDILTTNWDFIDDVYLITTTQPNNIRLENTQKELQSVNLWNNKINIRTFKPDDEDRVRGCYTSHISVLKEIQQQYNTKNNKDKDYKILILEDNLEKTIQMRSDTVLSIQEFLLTQAKNNKPWDVFHLAYMM